MSRSSTQCAAILAHLKSGKPITALGAQELCRCMRLAARINDLRKCGYPIITERVVSDSGASFARYRMELK